MNDRVRVLVVDDESVTRMMVRRVLLDSGYDVQEADHGQAALNLCRLHLPDLVLMDVRMPVMNGFDACRALRQMAGGQHVPVLMLTGLDDVMAVTLAFEAGATDFVTKPINWALLGQRVRYSLRTARTERQLRDSQQTLARAQKIARLAQWSKDLASGKCHCSSELREMLSLAGGVEFDMGAVQALIHADDQAAFGDFFDRICGQDGEQQVEVRMHDALGGQRHMVWSGSLTLDESGQPRMIFGITQDVTDRRDTEARLNYQAHFDTATGLPNRVLLRDRINTAIAAAQRGGTHFALLLLRTSALRMLHLNAAPGTSDKVLRAVADRISATLRDNDSLCRLGGERFALLLTSVNGEVDAAAATGRLLEAFAAPLAVDAWEVLSPVHIGIALHPADGDTVDTLLANASAAMDRAAEGGGSASRFFTDDIQQRVSAVVDTQVALYRGLERGEFALHYQPLVDLRSRRVVAVEALLRWVRPDRGLQMPDQFIPILEQTGLIMDAGEWVLRGAARAMRGLPLTLAINVSPRQLQHPNIASHLARVLDETGFPPGRLEVEITEQAVLADEDHAIGALHDLAARGMRITLDDYGMGFSSLQRLKRLPLHALKIDRFFVTSMLSDNADAAIVRSTIALCHELGIAVVAEGVEDFDTLARLGEYGCDMAQGYGIGRPMAMEELMNWLATSPFRPS